MWDWVAGLAGAEADRLRPLRTKQMDRASIIAGIVILIIVILGLILWGWLPAPPIQ